MLVTIQCASSKSNAAVRMKTADGREVRFVANPLIAPDEEGTLWARPDDLADDSGISWRQRLERQVTWADQARAFLPAYRLYNPAAYSNLVCAFGAQRVFILSAGWGLVRADFPLPDYDITFSANAPPHVRRRTRDTYQDFMQIPDAEPGPIVFLGGKDYLPLFKALVGRLKVPKIIVFRSDPQDELASKRTDGDWTYVPFPTTRCTNWHYGAAEALCRDAGSVFGA